MSCCVCGSTFDAKTPNAKYCGKSCQKLGQKVRNLSKKSAKLFVDRKPRFPKGRYVYVWLDDGLPFYVGKGVDGRAWKPHVNSREANMPYPCERIRLSSRNFQVIIVMDGLVEDQAALVEASLVKAFRGIGIPLRGNVVNPGTR